MVDADGAMKPSTTAHSTDAKKRRHNQSQAPSQDAQSAGPAAPLADAPAGHAGISEDERGAGDDAAPIGTVSAQEGMRYYAAIIGREPTLDPQAPDVLPGMSAGEEAVRNWAEDLSRVLRDEIARKLQIRLNRRPTWREIMEVMTQAAGRRLDEARKRFQRKDAA